MNVSLTRDLEELVREKVRTGLYNSSSEVIREALRLLLERDQLRELRLFELREKIKVGLDQADNDNVVSLDMKAIKKKARSIRKAGR